MLFIITGKERLLMDQKLLALKKEYPLGEEELNYCRLDCREYSCQDLLKEVKSAPFFSDYRMVVLTHPYFLTSEKGRSEKEKDIQVLCEALSHTDDSMIAVIFYEGKLDERKKIVKNLKKSATLFDFDHLDMHKMRATTRQAFIKRKTTIDDDALALLLERAGDSLLHIQTETEKLCLYSQHVTIEEVRRLVSEPLEENAFALTNALLKKDLAKVLSIYQDLITKNEEPVRLIAMIASSLRLLYQVTLLDRKGYNDQEIAKYLDVNPFRLRYVRMDSKNFELDDLLSLLAKLSDLDVKIKTGKIDKNQGLELFFLNLI